VDSEWSFLGKVSTASLDYNTDYIQVAFSAGCFSEYNADRQVMKVQENICLDDVACLQTCQDYQTCIK
jgi:hypothetical protein